MDLPTLTSFHRPATRDEAHTLDPAVAIIGGGTWLFGEPQPQLSGVIDLTALEWPSPRRSRAGLELAATTTIAQLARTTPDRGGRVHPLFPLCAAALLASFKIWETATVGGNVAASLPAGPMIGLLSLLEAEALLWHADGGDSRMLVSELVTGNRQNRLAPGDIIRSFHLPGPLLASRTGFRKIALSPMGRTGTLVLARYDEDGTTVFCITGGTLKPELLRFGALPTASELEAAVLGVSSWFTDAHGAADWRRAVSAVLAEEIRLELSAAPDGTDGSGEAEA